MNRIRDALFYKPEKTSSKRKRNSDIINTLIGMKPVMNAAGDGKKGNYLQLVRYFLNNHA